MQRGRMRGLLSLVGVMSLTLAACNKSEVEDLTKRLSDANDKVVSCKKDVNDLKNEVSALKRQLAQALANPNRIQMTDPEVINLIAELKAKRGGGGNDGPTLDPRAANKIVLEGAGAMRSCYERALKKNAALQYQAGVGLTLDITVKPTGSVDDVAVVPSIDHDMTSCIKNAAMRWKFPSFQGESVVIQQKVTLTPKT